MTLLELSATTAIVGLVLSTAIPRFMHLRDRIAVQGAANALVSTLADARHLAARWNRRTAIAVDTTAGAVTVHAMSDTLDRLDIGTTYGVGISTTRDSIAYAPSGLGFGAANTTFVLRRGAAADTVTVSRIGRVRH